MAFTAPHTCAASPGRERRDARPRSPAALRIDIDDGGDLVAEDDVRPGERPGLEHRQVRAADAAISDAEANLATFGFEGGHFAHGHDPGAFEEHRSHAPTIARLIRSIGAPILTLP